METAVEINLGYFFAEDAQVEKLWAYEEAAIAIVDGFEEVTLTGEAPPWMFLAIAQALQGHVRKLNYRSRRTGLIVIFDETKKGGQYEQ